MIASQIEARDAGDLCGVASPSALHVFVERPLVSVDLTFSRNVFVRIAMEVLISEVQRRNVLWNRRNPRHKDRVTAAKEWDSVAEITGFSKEEAKKKWRNLRDQFGKELKRIPKGESSESLYCAVAYPGKWQYFKNLLFLKDTFFSRDREGDVSLLEVSEDVQSSKNESVFIKEEPGTDVNVDDLQTHLEVNLYEAQTLIDSQSIEMPPSSTKAAPSRQKRKRKRENNIDEDQRLLEIEPPKRFAQLETPEDENSLFLRSLLPYFKRMDPLQQLHVRIKFQEIILQEMSQTQTRHFPSFNTNYSMGPSAAVLSFQSNYSETSSPTSSANSVISDA